MLLEVQKALTDLKLAGIARNLDDKIEYANSKELAYLDFIKLLIEDEKISRKNNSLKRRTNKAKIPRVKRVENFDFKFQPELNKSLILELATCSFIEKKQNIIFMGKPGTGKTHFAEAFGLKALLFGYTVLFTTAYNLISDLQKSKADGTYYVKLNNYIKPDLLIIDELGYKKFSQNGVDDFFEIVNQRYESKSIIITSNKTFEDWGSVLYDPVLASAVVDRLVHHSRVVATKGPSYRTKEYKEQNKKDENT